MTSGAFAQQAEISSRFARFIPRIDLARSMIVLALLPALIIVALVLGSVWLSFRTDILSPGLTLRHYIDLYSDPFAYRAFLNSIGFALSTLAVAFFFGVPIAWLTERTDLKGRSAIYTFMTLGIFIPSFFSAMGWLFLLHPRIGMVNAWLRRAFRRDHATEHRQRAGYGAGAGAGSHLDRLRAHQRKSARNGFASRRGGADERRALRGAAAACAVAARLAGVVGIRALCLHHRHRRLRRTAGDRHEQPHLHLQHLSLRDVESA